MSSNRNIKDLLHWKDMLSGDEAAFSLIFKQFYNSLYNFGKLYTADLALISDSIQDLFMDFWEKRRKISPDVNVRAYVFGAFRNKLFKKVKQKSALKHLNENQLNARYDSSVEEELIKNEWKTHKILKVQGILNQLPPKQKEVIYLKFYKGFSNHQISEVLEINYQSVKNHIYRSSLIFKKEFKDF